ncbi:hypothetical protein, variant [Verruconis gallopava]|uniref:C3H1-type domain-containing protein n=1 Tax=Verruconis gallopava TaxID=253628 RepID=A0A0D2AUD7_9PEZI|nr:hypothetical protein, variant [Verruconis gallopava]KIW02764.1 hypothetical protein, variant [Verruconis gallopava]
MVVCRFWERGNCRNGSNCKFEHPGARSTQSGGNPFTGGFGVQSRNPFEALRDDQPRGPRGGDSYRPEPRRHDNDRSRGQVWGGGGQSSGPDRHFRLDADTIRNDLTVELPQWPLSCYSGHPPDVPKHFFPPEMELSPEEVRTEYYLLRLQGREAQAQQKEASAAQAAQQAVADVVRDIHGHIRKIAAAKREHPNRWDIVDQNKTLGSANPFKPAPLPAVDRPGFTPASGFGQPLGFNSGPGTFGQPSVSTQTSAFGQPSQLGPKSAGFGQPAQPGQGPKFGQPSQLGPGSFGQASAIQGVGFGEPSQVGAQNQFTPSQNSQIVHKFHQTSQPQGFSTFGQPSQPQGSSTFGQPSTLGAKSAFGQPSASSHGSAFGQPSTFGSAGTFAKVHSVKLTNHPHHQILSVSPAHSHLK